jgi:hypothetical protein
MTKLEQLRNLPEPTHISTSKSSGPNNEEMLAKANDRISKLGLSNYDNSQPIVGNYRINHRISAREHLFFGKPFLTLSFLLFFMVCCTFTPITNT